MMRVLVVDREPIFRVGVRWALGQEPEIDVVGEAGDGGDAIRLTFELKPDVVLMDIDLPKVDGITATRQIKKTSPAVEIVVLSAREDQDSVLEAVQAGATGYLLKDIDPRVLLNAIRSLRAGLSTVHPNVTRRILERVSTLTHARATGESPKSIDGLTPRELEVLRVLAKGQSTRDLAASLSLSESTVKTHLRRIYRKIGVRHRTEAVAYAIRSGHAR